MDPKWRVITLSGMAITFMFLVVATFSTNWREDHEYVMNVFTTHGMWRICRDIIHGATVDHACLAKLANDAPTWFQSARAFLILAVLFVFIAFAHGVYIIANIPILKNKNARPPTISLGFPTIFMFLAAICTLVGVAIFAVATQMDQGLFFPEDKTPTWGNSWAQVMAKLNSIPSERPEDIEMDMSYGYSFALGWVSVICSTASFVVNLVASGRS